MYVTNLSSVRANIFKPRVTEHIPSRSLSILFNLYDACSIITTQPCHFQELYRSYAQHFKMYASLLLSKLRKTGWGKKKHYAQNQRFFRLHCDFAQNHFSFSKGGGSLLFYGRPWQSLPPYFGKTVSNFKLFREQNSCNHGQNCKYDLIRSHNSL
jgi:hypothetical protein